jgi:hypothetical protein
LLLKLTKLLLDFLNGLLKLGRVVLHLLRAVEGLFHLLDGLLDFLAHDVFSKAGTVPAARETAMAVRWFAIT